MKYNIGDVVIGIGNQDGVRIDGQIGKIIHNNSYSCSALVEFYEPFDGRLHDGDGAGKRGHCWNIPPSKLKKYEVEDPCIYNIDMDVFNQLIIS